MNEQPLSAANAPDQDYRERPVHPEEIKPRREITIIMLHHGYQVRVDCHQFAVESQEKLITLLDKYLSDPLAVERAGYVALFENYGK